MKRSAVQCIDHKFAVEDFPVDSPNDVSEGKIEEMRTKNINSCELLSHADTRESELRSITC